jgi:signal transduction histidine kinase
VTRNDSSFILQASLELSAALLGAVDEPAVLRAVMRTGCDVLGAQGCIFTPFEEFANKRPLLKYGNLPGGDSEGVSMPEVRQRCKGCKTRQAGGDCILLRDRMDDKFIYCLPLREHGRESGLFSFIFNVEFSPDDELKRFITESIHLAELKLDALERNRVIQAMQYSGHPTVTVTDAGSLLPEIEFRAIIGERTRLAREIHDGLAQSLAYLKIVIGQAESLLAQGKSEQAAHILRDSSHTINDIYLDARHAIENLRSSSGDLESWLSQVAADFTEISGMPVDLTTNLENQPSPDVQAQLIRIIQEALNNVRKHAGAKRVRVDVCQQNGDLLITVEDDGCGFNPTDMQIQSRFGLRGMRERAEAIGATLKIESQPGGGTYINIRIPGRPGDNS